MYSVRGTCIVHLLENGYTIYIKPIVKVSGIVVNGRAHAHNGTGREARAWHG